MKPFGCILAFIVLAACSDKVAKTSVTIDEKIVKAGNHYTIIYQNDCNMCFTNVRPSEKDTAIKLCIAAAFTRLDNGAIDGVYMIEGTNGKDGVNSHVGGALKIINGKGTIFPTNKGYLLTDSLMNEMAKQKASLFQQIQLIEDAEPAKFKDKALYQRRAIVHFKSGKMAVAECRESLTLADFSRDLVELGVQDALYTDMGGWDEGWYRHPQTNKPVIIGLMRTSTEKQSNWLIFTSKH